MIWLKPYIEKIRALTDQGDEESLTYAALQARLGLERVCYERLRIAHKYISPKDLRAWTPRHVVKRLMEEVDPKIASEWTLQIGKNPKIEPSEDEYVTIGTQKGFDAKLIGELWQAMSNFLHTELPTDSQTRIPHYKSARRMRAKIQEALQELERLSEGTLIGSSVFETVSFDCPCGQNNHRATQLLRHGSEINCYRENCKEQYIVHVEDDDIEFRRKHIAVNCRACGETHAFAHRRVTELPFNTIVKFNCEACHADNFLMWKLMMMDKKPNT